MKSRLKIGILLLFTMVTAIGCKSVTVGDLLTDMEPYADISEYTNDVKVQAEYGNEAEGNMKIRVNLGNKAKNENMDIAIKVGATADRKKAVEMAKQAFIPNYAEQKVQGKVKVEPGTKSKMKKFAKGMEEGISVSVNPKIRGDKVQVAVKDILSILEPMAKLYESDTFSAIGMVSALMQEDMYVEADFDYRQTISMDPYLILLSIANEEISSGIDSVSPFMIQGENKIDSEQAKRYNKYVRDVMKQMFGDLELKALTKKGNTYRIAVDKEILAKDKETIVKYMAKNKDNIVKGFTEISVAYKSLLSEDVDRDEIENGLLKAWSEIEKEAKAPKQPSGGELEFTEAVLNIELGETGLNISGGVTMKDKTNNLTILIEGTMDAKTPVTLEEMAGEKLDLEEFLMQGMNIQEDE